MSMTVTPAALTDEERAAIIDAVREFAQSRLAPNALDWDRRKHFPRDVLAEAGELGLGGIYVRDDVGGTGLRRTDAAAIFEQLAVGDPAIAAYISIHNMVAWMIDTNATEAQRQEWLPRLVTMRDLGAYCLTEPGAGSDAGSLKTRAVRDGDEYVITGQKIWTTDAHMADYMICLARTDPDVKPQAGLSMIIMPMDAPGVTVRPIDTIDGDAHVNEVFIEDVRVPARHLIGEPNTGWTQAKYLLGHERTHNAYLGMLRRYLARIPALIDDELDRGLPAAEASEYRRRHARLAIDVDALEWSVLRVLAGEEGPALGAAASAISILGAAYLLRAADLEMAILGPQVAPRFGPEDGAPLVGGAPPAAAGRTTQYLYWWAATIFGGSDEVQRNIIWSTLFR